MAAHAPPAIDKNCDGIPDSDLGEVQAVQGAGPSWLGRLVVNTDGGDDDDD